MPRRINRFIVLLACVSLTAFSFPVSSKADAYFSPRYVDSAYDLVNAVNALRASYGLTPYTISSILMYTAQAQADFMAANGTVTHSGPGGIGVTDRLLAAGYPLAGDLSLGGFRSENITGGSENMSAQAAVNQWTGDAPHLNTMISPDLTEIGAGVAVANGRVYYVIDCARPTTAGTSRTLITPVGGGTAVPAGEAPIQQIQALVVSTPNPEGKVIHEVKYGQSLWQVAISYETTIEEIKRLNNLSGNEIYPGEKLLVKPGVVVLITATETLVPDKTMTSIATTPGNPPTTTLQPMSTVTITPFASVTPPQNSIMGVVVGIIVLALLGGGVVAWMGAKSED